MSKTTMIAACALLSLGLLGIAARQPHSEATANSLTPTDNQQPEAGEKKSQQPSISAKRAKPKVPPPPPERVAEAKITAALGKRVSVDWKDKPISEAIAEVGKLGGFPVLVDKQALHDEGIMLDSQVRLRLKNVTLEAVCEIFLEPLALTYVIQDEVMRITTPSKAEEMLATRVYDLSKLVQLAHAWTARVEKQAIQNGVEHPFELLNRDLQRADIESAQGFFQLQPGPPVGGGLGTLRQTQINPSVGNGFSTAPPDHFPAEKTVEAIQKMVEQCAGSSWFGMDGTGGSIESHGMALIVRQTGRAHREIRALLNSFERILTAGGQTHMMPCGLSATYPLRDDATVRQALTKPVSVTYHKTKLREVLADLQKLTGIQFLIDEQSLMDEGIDADSPVELTAKSISLNSVLRTILEPLALDILVDYGLIRIMTITKAEEVLQTVFYDVSDLVVVSRDGTLALKNAIMNSTSGSWFDAGDAATFSSDRFPGVFVFRTTQGVHSEIRGILNGMRRAKRTLGVKPRPVTLETVETRIYRIARSELNSKATPAADLQKAILQLIDPKSWSDGKSVKLIHAGNSLVIRQTVRNHLRIAVFLNAYEKSLSVDLLLPLSGTGN